MEVEYSRARWVASVCTPANTVAKRAGFLSLVNASLVPGRAIAAAHPHTELTTKSTVPF